MKRYISSFKNQRDQQCSFFKNKVYFNFYTTSHIFKANRVPFITMLKKWKITLRLIQQEQLVYVCKTEGLTSITGSSPVLFPINFKYTNYEQINQTKTNNDD